MQCPVDKTEFQYWQSFIPYEPEVYLESFEVFDSFLALEERKNGLIHIKILPFNNEAPHYIKFDDVDYMVYVSDTPEMSSLEVRYVFSSLKHPRSVYDYNVKTQQKTLKKQTEVLGGFKTDNYETKRVFAKARDGILIPISVVYRKDKFQSSKNPILIDGYGSYGLINDPSFNAYVISLLDRGFVYAIAHIRGGSEMGRQWYLDSKLLRKKNTFYDFIDCTEHLAKTGMADPHKIYATGGSAGGLLMGAVANMRPDLYKGIVAIVPFVDMMNTMLDPNIPLTTAEYAEWGNPNDKEYYDYMMSYSPYDNIRATDYPHILAVAAYHDSQVQYWEPAKWVAKLRTMKTDHHLLLLRTFMNEGHSGASGRYETYHEQAFEYAFILGLEDKLIE
jgi:oligopeptidase B